MIGKARACFWLAFVIGFAVLYCAGGCTALQPISQDYRKADKQTFDTVAPDFTRYVASDPALNLEQKQRRRDAVDTWRIRVEKSAPR